MTQQVSVDEQLERQHRVRMKKCPRCGAIKGNPCRYRNGRVMNYHHAARWARVYPKRGRR